MNRFFITGALSFALGSAGCATVTEGDSQMMTINSTPVPGANCIFTNNRGQWDLVTPGTMNVKKSVSMLHGHCVKVGYKDADVYLSAESDSVSLAGMAVPYAGLVELAVDSSTGATSKYPESYTVRLKPLDQNLPTNGSMPAAGAAAPGTPSNADPRT